MAVVFYHAEFSLFKGGWLGVDVFFVISGYLISNIIISELNSKTFSFKSFYKRRAKRILPALFSIILITIPFAYFLMSPKAMAEYISSIFASVFFFANFHFQNLDFYVSESAKVMPLLHTWSLAVEEQFYIIFPVFTVLIYRYLKKYFTALILIMTVVSIYINTLIDGVYKFYQLHFRAWELLLGVLVMIFSSNLSIKHLEKVGFPLLVIPMFYFDDAWINDIEPKLISLTGVALLIFSNSRNTVTTKLLSIKALSIIGISSYSIYLLHQPIFVFFRLFNINKHLYFQSYSDSIDIINDPPVISENPYGTVFLICIILILFLVGTQLYKYVEINKKRSLIALINLIFLLIFSISQTIKIDVYNQKFDQTRLTKNEAVFTDYGCWGNFSDWSGTADIDNCFIDNGFSENLVFIGDSSTAAIVKNFTKENELNDKFNYLFLTPASHKIFFSEIDFKDQCNDCVIELFRNKKYVNTFIISLELHRFIEDNTSVYYTDTYSDNNNSEILFSNLEQLSLYGKEIIFIEPFPTMLANKPTHLEIILSKNIESIQEIYIPYSDWKKNINKTDNFIEQLNSSIPNLHTIETQNIFCGTESNKCVVYKSPITLYLDRYHLTSNGGLKIANEIIKYIDK